LSIVKNQTKNKEDTRMPLSATTEQIKAYQAQVEKDKITPEGLPPCPICQLEPLFFKLHAYRERRFLLIIEMLVKSIFCTLVRFRCTGCGKTFTQYPDFAIPHKHYTRQSIENFSAAYVNDDQKTYKTAVMTDDGMPWYEDNRQALSASTIYHWITALARLITSSGCDGFAKIAHKAGSHFYNHPDFAIAKRKYRTSERKRCLLRCLHFFSLNVV
jgi:transposase-like protein